MDLDLYVFSNEYGWWLMEKSTIDKTLLEYRGLATITMPYLVWIADIDNVKRATRFMINGEVYLSVHYDLCRPFDTNKDGIYLRAALSYMSHTGRWCW